MPTKTGPGEEKFHRRSCQPTMSRMAIGAFLHRIVPAVSDIVIGIGKIDISQRGLQALRSIEHP